MNRIWQLVFLALLSQLFLPGQIRAQQPGRLMAYGPSALHCLPIPNLPPPSTICQNFPLRFSLFEVDPGSFDLTETPINPPTLPITSNAGIWYGTYDTLGGRLFVYDTAVGGMLYTIDAGSGALLHSTLVGLGLWYLHFESSSQRLLAMMGPAMLPALFEVDVVSGTLTQLSAGINTFLVPFTNGLLTALDDAGHRLFLHGGPGFLIIDTFTGAQIGTVSLNLSGIPPLTSWLGTVWDPIHSKIVAFNNQGPVGLLTIDPVTGIVATVGPGFPGVGATTLTPHAMDVQRRLYHIFGTSTVAGGPALHTFDLLTGQLVADPASVGFAGGLLGPYFLFIDSAHPPQKGRVSFSPTNNLAPAGLVTVDFEAIGHGNDWYFPFVSCTPGSFSVPSSNMVLPLAFDSCTSLYFLSPASSQFFNLTPNNGTIGDILSPAGTAQGSVMMPAFVPQGLNFDLRITFITLDQMGQWSGAHGLGIVHVTS